MDGIRLGRFGRGYDMRIYAVDDEQFMLEALVDALREAVPQAEIVGFEDSLKLLGSAQKSPCDVAFLDVQMPDVDGVNLARRLLGLKRDMNIVFVTAFDEYKADAMDLHASDYVTKPVTTEKIREAMANLRHPIGDESRNFRAFAFGNFALYANGRPVDFHRKKSAELLAYLVHRRGTIVSRQELTLVLFDDDMHLRQSQKMLDNAVRTLVADLETVGAADLFVRTPEGFAVNWALLSSDLADYLAGDTFLYLGDYMEQYSWGERFKGGVVAGAWQGTR